MRPSDIREYKRTISGAAAAAIRVGGVTTICHCNFVLLIDMAAPHTLCIDPGIGAATEGAPQTGLLTLWPRFAPAFLEVLFLGRTPTPWGFELSWIWNSVWVAIRRRDEILRVQKPVFVFCHDIVCETLRILLGVREICERRVEEYGIWVGGCGVHGVHNVG